MGFLKEIAGASRCAGGDGMRPFRENAFYLLAWRAFLVALITLVLMITRSFELAAAFLIGANVALLFSLSLMVWSEWLSEERIIWTKAWRMLKPSQQPAGRAGRRWAHSCLSDVALRARSIHLFDKVTDAYLPTLLKSASIRFFPGRVVLFKEGDRANALYTLMHGSVELFSEPNCRRVTIAIIRSAKPFVLTSLADEINPMAARTLERSEFLLVPLKAIHELIDMDPSFARAIMYELA